MDKIEKSHKFGQSFGKIWSTVFSINYHMCIFCILFCFDCLLLIFFLFFPSVFIHSSRAPSISIEDLKVACGIFQRSDIQVYSTSQSQLPPSTLAQGGQSSVSNPPRACVAWKLGTSVVSQYIGGNGRERGEQEKLSWASWRQAAGSWSLHAPGESPGGQLQLSSIHPGLMVPGDWLLVFFFFLMSSFDKFLFNIYPFLISTLVSYDGLLTFCSF